MLYGSPDKKVLIFFSDSPFSKFEIFFFFYFWNSVKTFFYSSTTHEKKLGFFFHKWEFFNTKIYGFI